MSKIAVLRDATHILHWNEVCMEHQPEIDKQKRAYELTFLIENLMRVAMHNIMTAKQGANYFDEKALPEFEYREIKASGKINVVNAAKQRKGTERRYNLALGYDYPFFWYLDFRVIISLIDVFWTKYFHRMFKTKSNKVKQEIISRLKLIVPIRNAVAHHRYLSNVDVADLEGCYKILRANLNPDYVRTFSNLALNSLEGIVGKLVASCQDLRYVLGKGKYVDRDKIFQFVSSFSAVVSATDIITQVSLFEDVMGLLKRYNQLPRKPGRSKDIELFIEQTSIATKIALLSDLVGGYV